jgi:hypothetical protein
MGKAQVALSLNWQGEGYQLGVTKTKNGGPINS